MPVETMPRASEAVTVTPLTGAPFVSRTSPTTRPGWSATVLFVIEFAEAFVLT